MKTLQPSTLLLYREFESKTSCQIIDVSVEFNTFMVKFKKKIFAIRGIHTPLNTESAMQIANNKVTSKVAMKLFEIPTLPYLYLHKESVYSEEKNRIAAFLEQHKRLVCKPIDGMQSKGVYMNITTETELQEAWDEIMKLNYKGMIMEPFFEGDVYRLLYVNGQLVAALKREIAYVTGDGKQTLAELIESKIAKGSPLSNQEKLKNKAFAGAISLGHTLETIPEIDSKVVIADVTGEETLTEVTELVNKNLAENLGNFLASIDLNLCGLDIISKDISSETNSFVLEINKQPNIAMHHSPDIGNGINVSKLIVEAICELYK